MYNIIRVAEHLRRVNYPRRILTPLTDAEGNLLHRDEAGGVWRVFPYFAQTVTLSRPEHKEQVRAAAGAYGEFLHCLRDLPPTEISETLPHFHDANYRKSQLLSVLQNAAPERRIAARREIDIIESAFSFLAQMSHLTLPRRITHNDTKISNLLFAPDRRTPVAVIDWDTIMPGTVLSDFGDMVRTFCNDAAEDEADLKKVKFNRDYYIAAEKGFLAETQNMLTPAEKENLYAGARRVILVQAMRFLTDFLAGDVYYKTTYPEQNLLRVRNQLALYEEM